MLIQRRRRWSNNKPTLIQRLVHTQQTENVHPMLVEMLAHHNIKPTLDQRLVFVESRPIHSDFVEIV